MSDNIGFDGISVREAIALRTLEAVDRLVEAQQIAKLTWDAFMVSSTILLETVLPFCDPETKQLLTQIQKQWFRENELRLEAAREEAIASGALESDFGKFG